MELQLRNILIKHFLLISIGKFQFRNCLDLDYLTDLETKQARKTIIFYNNLATSTINCIFQLSGMVAIFYYSTGNKFLLLMMCILLNIAITITSTNIY